MLTDEEVAPSNEIIGKALVTEQESIWELLNSSLEEDLVPTRLRITQSAIDKYIPVPADPNLSYQLIFPFQNFTPMDILPIELKPNWIIDYQASSLSIINPQLSRVGEH
jgi:hypothetical protein